MLIIKKSNLLDNTILLLMYLQLIILEFLGFGQMLNKVIALLIIVRLVISLKRRKIEFIIPVILIVLFLIGCLVGQEIHFNIMKSNFLMLFYSYIYLYYIFFLCKNKNGYIDTLLKKMFIPFNLTMVINIIVLFIQITHPYLITAKITSIEIDYLEDTISGLFAYGATHVVSLFTTFIVLYNFSYAKGIRKANVRKLLRIYTCILILITSFIALFNDNKAFFILMPMILLIFWYADKEKRSLRLNRIVMSCFILPIFLYVLYLLSVDFREFIDNNFLSLYRMILNSVNLGSMANGSNERIAMIFYALKCPDTYLFGKGFGSVGLYQAGVEGFRHFGQADFGTLLILGGVWFTSLLLCSYIKMLNGIIAKKKLNEVVGVGIIIIVLILTAYTQCVTRTNCTMCLILIALSLRYRFGMVVNRNN